MSVWTFEIAAVTTSISCEGSLKYLSIYLHAATSELKVVLWFLPHWLWGCWSAPRRWCLCSSPENLHTDIPPVDTAVHSPTSTFSSETNEPTNSHIMFHSIRHFHVHPNHRIKMKWDLRGRSLSSGAVSGKVWTSVKLKVEQTVWTFSLMRLLEFSLLETTTSCSGIFWIKELQCLRDAVVIETPDTKTAWRFHLTLSAKCEMMNEVLDMRGFSKWALLQCCL